ncbi:MAG: hypothetical protein SNJ56_00670, partial [Termitinemataceae bacterium]
MMKTSTSHEWSILETQLNHQVGKMETLFALANGNLGIRGDYDEPTPAFHRGTYINGFFEKEPIIYGEIAYGYAENHETILNLPDPKIVNLIVNGEIFRLDSAEIRSYKRCLDMQTGLLIREVEARLPGGCVVLITSRRLVSLSRDPIGAIEYRCTLLESPTTGPVQLVIEAPLDGIAENRKAGQDPRVGSKFSKHPYIIKQCTAQANKAKLLLETHT